MESKVPTEHAQMHAGKCERWEKWDPKGEGEIGNGKGGKLKLKIKNFKMSYSKIVK